MSKTRVVHTRRDYSDVYIGRPSIFGNPFEMGRDGTRAEVVAAYRSYFLNRVTTDTKFAAQVAELRGKSLGCYCAPLACHGDVIVEWVEGTGHA